MITLQNEVRKAYFHGPFGMWLMRKANDVYHNTEIPVSEIADAHMSMRSRDHSRMDLCASMHVLMFLLVAGTQCLSASSLSGIVMNEGFVPLSGVRVMLLLETKQEPQRMVSTDDKGAFTFSHLAPGDYSVRVDHFGFVRAEIENIHITEGETHRLRRILLEAGEGAGNCVVRIYPTSFVERTSEKDVEISGRVSVGRGETVAVTLVVFTEDGGMERSMISDNKGRFRFVVPLAGDVRLVMAIRNRSGKIIMPEEQANLRWADLGDRIGIPNIKLTRSGLGHFCY
jgi:hypothetical protein